MILAEVIKQVESAGNQYALRFEPHAFETWLWNDTMNLIQKVHGCSQGTARMLACTSWGAYQLMGLNLYDPACGAFKSKVFDYLAFPGAQDDSFQAFLKAKDINYSLEDILGDEAKMTAFVTHWNGPGNVAAYSSLIRKAAGA